MGKTCFGCYSSTNGILPPPLKMRTFHGQLGANSFLRPYVLGAEIINKRESFMPDVFKWLRFSEVCASYEKGIFPNNQIDITSQSYGVNRMWNWLVPSRNLPHCLNAGCLFLLFEESNQLIVRLIFWSQEWKEYIWCLKEFQSLFALVVSVVANNLLLFYWMV